VILELDVRAYSALLVGLVVRPISFW